jgi:hypothetical protein
MKYFLILGILFKKYKKPAQITIHIGEKFVDTFTLDTDFLYAKDILKHIKPDIFAKLDKSFWLTRADWVDRWKQIPKLFKVYELNDCQLLGKLKLKVDNSNSDFTNGFMRNSSLIKIPIAALINKEAVKNGGEELLKELVQLVATTETNQKSLNWMHKRWPVADNFKITREDTIDNQSADKNRFWWIGGSFIAEYNIVSMGGNKYLGTVDDTEWAENPRTIDVDDLVLASCGQLLNIYNEDQ